MTIECPDDLCIWAMVKKGQKINMQDLKRFIDSIENCQIDSLKNSRTTVLK